MDISLDLSDGVPIYRQIVNQIRYLIASGLLVSGEELPPIRALALRLKVTPNTIVKAYDELEAAGVVHKRRGSGTYVSDTPTKLAAAERTRIIEQRIDGLLAEAHQLSFSIEDVIKVIHRRRAAMARSKTDTSRTG